MISSVSSVSIGAILEGGNGYGLVKQVNIMPDTRTQTFRKMMSNQRKKFLSSVFPSLLCNFSSVVANFTSSVFASVIKRES